MNELGAEKLSPGEQKIKEYMMRINNGESIDEITKDLPKVFVEAIKERLEKKDDAGKQQLSETEPISNHISKPNKKSGDEDRGELARIRQELGLINPEQKKAWTSEDLLRKVAEYSDQYMQGPKEAVADGTFGGRGKLHIDEGGNVVLIRHARDKEHLIKDGRPTTAEDLRESSEFTGGSKVNGAVHTTAELSNTSGYTRYGMYGVFKIPADKFVDLAREGKLIIGNLGEQEIVISGDVAEKYLSEVHEK